MRIPTRTGPRPVAAALALAGLLALAGASSAAGATTVSFATAPAIGNLTAITLNGRSQTTNTTWNLTSNPFAVTSSGTNSGWNLTLGADTGGGSTSSVFAQYCPSASCGTDTGPGYVAGGFTLPADSLTLKTGSSGWTSAAPKPTYQCNTNPWCQIDNATPVKIVSASTSVALGTWQTSGTATLQLATATTMHKLQTGEVYRVDLVWTLGSGP
jgi:hypothetical protein